MIPCPICHYFTTPLKYNSGHNCEIQRVPSAILDLKCEMFEMEHYSIYTLWTLTRDKKEKTRRYGESLIQGGEYSLVSTLD
jgi:hypothetical protein